MAKKNSDKSTAEQPAFEKAIAQLELIVQELEEGKIGLNEALACYERGVGLLRRCHELLEGVERKIELLGGVDADGNPVVEPFDHADLSLEEKATHRGRRRTAKGPPAE